MVTQNAKKRTGRKPNKWTLLAFKDIADHLSKTETPVTKFVKVIGVSNQTFHNWKNNRCAPTTEVQQRIKDTIEGNLPGEKLDMAKKTTKATPAATAAPKAAKKKTTKKKARRGKGSASLAALAGATPGETDTKAAAVAIKDTTPKKKKKAGRRPGPRKAAAPAVAKKATKAKPRKKAGGSNGTSSASPTQWAELSTLGAFLKANPDKTREELAGIVDVARELLV
jgi:DNA-binding XRE family transcriptional regulator